MATRLLNSRTRFTAYLPNLQTLVRHFTVYPAQEGPVMVMEEEEDYFSEEQLKLGPFGTQSKVLPIPGNIGMTRHVISPITLPTLKEQMQVVDKVRTLRVESMEEKHGRVMLRAKMISDETESQYLHEPRPSPFDLLEFTAQECPRTLRKEFAGLFPGRNIMEGNLTVVTISHRTENDMSGWSEEVEKEREVLLDAFVRGAITICQTLTSFGHWADFVDPSSGMPYYGSHTNSVFFETDERYKKLGFEIDDLGCCKVISHHIWGTHAYVGCLFTNAKLDEPMLENIKKIWQD